MNENMYQHKITQGNIEKLKDLGYKIVGPVRGRLADGRIGLGHLASIEDISKAVKKSLKMAA
jgi:phosphopantothenoylcysteine synthetase/decarboxylase